MHCVLISAAWECRFPDDGALWCFLPDKAYTPLYSESRQGMALTFPRESEMRGPDKSVTTRRTYYDYRLSTNPQSKDRAYHVCRADLVPPRARWIASRHLCPVPAGVLPHRGWAGHPVRGWLSALRRLSARCALPRR